MFKTRTPNKRYMKNQRGKYKCQFLVRVAKHTQLLYYCPVLNEIFKLPKTTTHGIVKYKRNYCGSCKYFFPTVSESYAPKVNKNGSLEGWSHFRNLYEEATELCAKNLLNTRRALAGQLRTL